LQDVIDGGYCIGCGGCAALDPNIVMGFDDTLRLQARLAQDHAPTDAAVQACPFTGAGPDEDALARDLFTDPAIVADGRIGRHLACFAGWVEEGDLRQRGSSGGIGTWLQRELLARGMVDAVLNVAPQDGQGEAPLFSFTVARTPDEVVANARTRYYPVEMSGVIRHVLDHPGRYAAIGTPCFAKALRLAGRQSPELRERLPFVLGIVCGHLKTAAFAQSLAWQCGIEPDGVQGIDFRAKLEGRPASRYGVSVTGPHIDGTGTETVTRPMEGLIGANWGHGLFKYQACEFCDDVLAETADAVVGDAWLPAYDDDHRGTNVVIVRHPGLLAMLAEARDAGRLHLDDLTPDAVAQSQAGGLRHRREGLAYRLWLTDLAGLWRPRKRVAAAQRHLSPSMRRIHAARYALGQASHGAWQAARAAGDPALFARRMGAMIAAYDRLMKPGFAARMLQLVERKIDAVLFRVGLRR
jgi:coenzyme F420-reducing hydrogenase beta subunit